MVIDVGVDADTYVHVVLFATLGWIRWIAHEILIVAAMTMATVTLGSLRSLSLVSLNKMGHTCRVMNCWF